MVVGLKIITPQQRQSLLQKFPVVQALEQINYRRENDHYEGIGIIPNF
ncbi:MAG: hypothetical protein V7L25_12985 [Nostoc sp.]